MLKTPSISRIAMLIALAATLAAPGAPAKDPFIMETDSIGRTDHGHVNSDQLLELGSPTSSSLRLEGEQSLRMGNIDRSLMVLQKSLEMDPSDLDGRIMYAEALEKKLRKQKDRDPGLYNFCVKQWLYVARHSYFADQTKQAQNHLNDLTGVPFKKWYTSRKYLMMVMLPEDGKTKVALSDKQTTDKDE